MYKKSKSFLYFASLIIIAFLTVSSIFIARMIVNNKVIQKNAEAANIYSGTYTNGLTVSQDGAIVENADISNSGSGDCLIITGDNVTVRNSRIHNCKGHGVKFLGTNGGILENSEVYRAAMVYTPNSVGSGWPSLIKVQSVDETSSGLSQNIIIRNNYVHEGYGECMGLRGSNILVTGNHAKDCYSIGIYSNSDHTRVENNFVECTGNPEFNRSGQPMVGIGFAEESFSNWGAHGHDSQKVVNNIVVGCKYGVRYGSSTNNKGLSNSTIAFNTVYRTTSTGISITYYSSQTGNLIENNIAASISANSAGITIIGNVPYTFARSSVPADFQLTSPLPAQGPYSVATDYFNRTRVSPLDAGASDFGSSQVTATPRPTGNISPTPVPSGNPKPGDVNRDGNVDILDFQLLSNSFGKTVGQTGYNPNANFNADGKVDILDFQILSNNFGN